MHSNPNPDDSPGSPLYVFNAPPVCCVCLAPPGDSPHPRWNAPSERYRRQGGRIAETPDFFGRIEFPICPACQSAFDDRDLKFFPFGVGTLVLNLGLTVAQYGLGISHISAPVALYVGFFSGLVLTLPWGPTFAALDYPVEIVFGTAAIGLHDRPPDQPDLTARFRFASVDYARAIIALNPTWKLV